MGKVDAFSAKVFFTMEAQALYVQSSWARINCKKFSPFGNQSGVRLDGTSEKESETVDSAEISGSQMGRKMLLLSRAEKNFFAAEEAGIATDFRCVGCAGCVES